MQMIPNPGYGPYVGSGAPMGSAQSQWGQTQQNIQTTQFGQPLGNQQLGTGLVNVMHAFLGIVQQLLGMGSTAPPPQQQVEPSIHDPNGDGVSTVAEMKDVLNRVIERGNLMGDSFDAAVIRRNALNRLDDNMILFDAQNPDMSRIDDMVLDPPPVIRVAGRPYHNSGISADPVVYNLLDALQGVHTSDPKFGQIYGRLLEHSQRYGMQGALFAQDLPLLAQQLQNGDTIADLMNLSLQLEPESLEMQALGNRVAILQMLSDQIEFARAPIHHQLAQFYRPV